MKNSGLMFPKPGPTKKRRRAHPASILHRKEDGTCFLCVMLKNDFRIHGYREEHHTIYYGADVPDEYQSEVLRDYLTVIMGEAAEVIENATVS